MAARIAIYVRVSTQEQGEAGFSLSAQESAGRRYAAEQGCDQPAIVADVCSAFNDDINQRPAFAALMADVGARLYDVVCVSQLDRFARSNIVAVQQLRYLFDNGCTLVSLAERWDFSTASGRFQFQLMSSLAEFDSRLKSERTAAGIAAKRARGGHHGALPWGAVRDERGRLALDDARAATLRDILGWAATRSGHWIAARLNERGVPTRQSGHLWRPNAVYSLVRASGWLRELPEPWPALHSAAVARPPLPRAPAGRGVNLLSGLMACACGGRIVYSSPNRHGVRYLACRHYGARERPTGEGCPITPKRRVTHYEAAVEAWLLALPDLAGATGRDDDAATAARRVALAERKRIAEELYYTTADRATYLARLAALQAEGDALPRQVADGAAVAALVASAQAAWPDLDTAERNGILRRLLARVTIAGPECAIEPAPALAALLRG